MSDGVATAGQWQCIGASRVHGSWLLTVHEQPRAARTGALSNRTEELHCGAHRCHLHRALPSPARPTNQAQSVGQSVGQSISGSGRDVSEGSSE